MVETEQNNIFHLKRIKEEEEEEEEKESSKQHKNRGIGGGIG